MTPPMVSIIIPVFNRRVLLEETLNSILAQEFSDWECIVVDDRSTDGTQEVVNQFSNDDTRFSLVVKPESLARGPSASRNIGLGAAKGQYIHFFDSDDLLDVDFYSQLIPRILAKQLDCMIVRIKWFHEETAEINLSPEITQGNFIADAIVKRHELWTQNIIWKHSLLQEGTAFNETLTMSEDIEFAVRKMSKALRIDYSNEIFVNIRRHHDSLTFDSDFDKTILRNVSVFDAYDAILQSLKQSKSLNEAVEDYCYKVKYKSISESLQLGVLDKRIFLRQLKLIRQSMVALRARPFFGCYCYGRFLWLLVCARN